MLPVISYECETWRSLQLSRVMYYERFTGIQKMRIEGNNTDQNSRFEGWTGQARDQTEQEKIVVSAFSSEAQYDSEIDSTS